EALGGGKVRHSDVHSRGAVDRRRGPELCGGTSLARAGRPTLPGGRLRQPTLTAGTLTAFTTRPSTLTDLLGDITMAGSVILAGARTPIGKLSGALAGFSAAELGGLAIKASLERAGLTGAQIDYVFMGQVLQAGSGQIA